MAITLTQVSKPHAVGDRWRTIYTAALDSNYATGGYSVKPTDLGFSPAVDPDFLVELHDSKGYDADYDYTAQKIVIYTSAGTQTTATTDLSAISLLRIVAYGKYRA